MEDLLCVQRAGHPVRFEPELNRVTFLSDYTTPDDVFRLRLELPGLQAVTIRSQIPFDRVEELNYPISMKTDKYKVGQKVICNGFPGTVVALNDYKMVEVRLSSGHVCVDAEDKRTIRPLRKVRIVSDNCSSGLTKR